MDDPSSRNFLDCIGLFCPNPIIQTSKRLKELPPGSLLEVAADDETFPKDIPEWCSKMGYELLELTNDGGEFRAVIRKP